MATKQANCAGRIRKPSRIEDEESVRLKLVAYKQLHKRNERTDDLKQLVRETGKDVKVCPNSPLQNPLFPR